MTPTGFACRSSAGTDKLEEASWDEAFAAIEAGLMPVLEEHGRESLALSARQPDHPPPGARPSTWVRWCVPAGPEDLYSASTVDQMPQHVVSGLLWGDPNAFPDSRPRSHGSSF